MFFLAASSLGKFEPELVQVAIRSFECCFQLLHCLKHGVIEDFDITIPRDMRSRVAQDALHYLVLRPQRIQV
jgi:hypothetical protein